MTAWVAALVAVALARDARAQASTTDAPEMATESHWYGWQTLLVDAVAVAVYVSGALDARPEQVGNVGLWTGVLGYLVGPPIVHWAHGYGWRGAGDLGLRVAAPVLLAITGLAANPDAGGAVGLLVGYTGAVVFDAAVLAWDTTPEPVDTRSAGRAWSVTPQIAASHRGGSLALRIAF